MIDLTTPKGTYVVPTSKGGYMGPEVKVNANSSEQAIEKVKEAGHTPNSYFPPRKVRE